VSAYVVVISYYNITANAERVLTSPYNHTIISPYYNYNHSIIYQPKLIIQKEKRERRDSSILDRRDRRSRTQHQRGLTTWV